jgi:hypothetical protein
MGGTMLSVDREMYRSIKQTVINEDAERITEMAAQKAVSETIAAWLRREANKDANHTRDHHTEICFGCILRRVASALEEEH